MKLRFLTTLIFIVCLISWVVLQKQFLTSDAVFHSSSVGRGDWTDEGLNTFQLRNFIITHHLDLNSGDDLIKTPLFNLVLFTPLLISNTFLTARLTILVIVLLLFFLISKYSSQTLAILLLLIPFSHEVVFQYFHLAMAESWSTLCIALSIFLLQRTFTNPEFSNKRFLLATLPLFAAVLLKLQFVYILLLLPLLASNIFLSNRKKTELRKSIFIMGAFFLILILVFLGWYLPFQNIFHRQLNNQSFSLKLNADTPLVIWWNLKYLFNSGYSKIFLIAFISCLLIGLRFFKNAGANFRYRFLLSIFWCLLESHKLMMTYLPHRYMVSFWFSIGFLIAIVLHHILSASKNLISRITVFFAAVSISITQLINISWQFEHRSFFITEANKKFQSINTAHKTSIGVWSTILCWNSEVETYPVWVHQQFQNPVKDLNATFIISEKEEADSDGAFIKHGIHLADSYLLKDDWLFNGYDLQLYQANQ